MMTTHSCLLKSYSTQGDRASIAHPIMFRYRTLDIKQLLA